MVATTQNPIVLVVGILETKVMAVTVMVVADATLIPFDVKFAKLMVTLLIAIEIGIIVMNKKQILLKPSLPLVLFQTTLHLIGTLTLVPQLI